MLDYNKKLCYPNSHILKCFKRLINLNLKEVYKK